jgi:hypothetical protein
MNPEQIAKALDLIESGDATGALELIKELIAGAPADTGGEDALSDDPAPVPSEEEQAALSALTRLTGAESAGEAVITLETWAKRIGDQDARENAFELTKRKALVGVLVKLKKESPASAYTDREKGILCDRLSRMPIDELAGLVELHRKEGATGPEIKAPVASAPVLTERQIALCKKQNVSPEDFLARRASVVRRAGA